MKHLDVVFSYRVAHEHGVKGGDLIDTHAGHSNHLKRKLLRLVVPVQLKIYNDLGNVVHGSDGQPAAMLPLCKVEQGDDRGPLVPVGVDRHDCLRAGVVLRCELKSGLMIVLCSVPGKELQT